MKKKDVVLIYQMIDVVKIVLIVDIVVAILTMIINYKYMAKEQLKITYETLFELLKREKDKTDLHKLEAAFFHNAFEYLKEKKESLKKDDQLSGDERKKRQVQIDNAGKIIKSLYERREKKILMIALTKSRTKSDVIDFSPFLDSEKKFLDSVVEVLDSFRKDVVERVIMDKEVKSN